MDATDLKDTQAAAAYLGVPATTLEYWRSRRTGPSWFRLGRRTVYRRESLDAYVSAQESAQATTR